MTPTPEKPPLSLEELLRRWNSYESHGGSVVSGAEMAGRLLAVASELDTAQRDPMLVYSAMTQILIEKIHRALAGGR